MRIKMLIENKNVSPTAFAKMIDFNQSNLSKILRGEREVPTNLINAICDKLEIPYKWLVAGEGQMPVGMELSVDEAPMDAVTQRFFDVLEHINVTPYKLSKEVDGITSQKLSNAKKGRNNISSDIIANFGKYYTNVNLSYILTGEGSMFKDGAEPMAKNILPATAINYEKGVPYYDIDFLGGFDFIINEKTSMPSYMIDYQPYNKADAWCNITGHSMEPLISSGDVIAIKELKDWMDFIPYGEIYAIITEEHRTIKRVTKSERGNDFLQLIPENKSIEYQPQDLPKKLILKIFKVLGAMKRF